MKYTLGNERDMMSFSKFVKSAEMLYLKDEVSVQTLAKVNGPRIGTRGPLLFEVRSLFKGEHDDFFASYCAKIVMHASDLCPHCFVY